MNTPQIRSEIETHDFMSLTYHTDKKKRLVKRGTWKKLENHNLYAEYLGRKKGFKKPEDWYKVNLKDFTDNYGGGLLSGYYNSSPLEFLESVFPKENWLPWKFGVSSSNTWQNEDRTFNMINHKLYAEYLGRKKRFQRTRRLV